MRAIVRLRQKSVWKKAPRSNSAIMPSHFEGSGPDGYSYYFHDLRKGELDLMSRQHGGGSVMVWGAITSNEPLELDVLNG